MCFLVVNMALELNTQLISLIEDLNFHMDHDVQVDMILLDFSKAFDTVPHCRLLKKLKFYHNIIENQVIQWLEKWLTARKQRALLDGESSDHVPVLSSVPQGTVLGPLMFLIYINEITKDISSQLRLFADDCLLYRTIKSEQDSVLLQQDLDTLSLWAKVWQMRFNLGKCTVIRCTRSHNPMIINYSLHGFTLSVTNKHMYLGVMLDDQLSWSIHITNVANKATRMLNFLKRHLSKCSSIVKASAYLLMVRPLMEYACVVWDPHYQSQVSVLERVQRCVARWVLSDYSYHSSVSSMLEQLNWLPLANRRKQQRLNLFYQIMNEEISLSLPDYYHFTNRYTRQHHPFHLIIPPTNTTSYMTSYFPRTIWEWNSLPPPLIEVNSLAASEQSSCVFEPIHKSFVIV